MFWKGRYLLQRLLLGVLGLPDQRELWLLAHPLEVVGTQGQRLHRGSFRPNLGRDTANPPPPLQPGQHLGDKCPH